MSSAKTKLTELGTALGMFYEPSRGWPEGIESLDMPGIPAETWRPVVHPVTAPGHRDRDLLLRALDNGRRFRQVVLRDRSPEHIEWVGGSQAVWTSDIPRDLTVDRVYFIQAKYDSSCVLNTAPASMVDGLLAEGNTSGQPSWFEDVAPRELQAYYLAVRGRHDLHSLPPDVREITSEDRAQLRTAMRATSAPSEREQAAYAELCRSVSEQTARRWRRRLEAATNRQRSEMVFRMLRIAGGPYWLLGTKGAQPVRLTVDDTRRWRQRFELRRFNVADAHAGQPQVNWQAEVTERIEPARFPPDHEEPPTSRRHLVEGFCELRWSHGKLQGNPECKVQVTTRLAEIPGYEPMG